MLFKDIPGLDEVKQSLLQAVQKGQIAHAQLFFGNEGSANLSLALAYATYINCENRQPEDACGQCAACSKINKYIHPDLHFVFPVAATKKVNKDPLSENFLPEWRTYLKENLYGNLSDWCNFIGTENRQPIISAEESRSIIQKLSLKAYEASYKVLLIWLPEHMNITSANALLKILEEPPPKTVFLLVSQSIDKILTTILSRTQLVRIRPFTSQEIWHILVDKHEMDAKRAVQVAYLSDGSLSEALRLSKESLNDNHVWFRDWMRLCFRANFTDLVEWAEKFNKLTKEGQKSVLLYGTEIVRETLMNSFKEAKLNRLEGEELTFVEGFAKVITPTKAELLYNQFNDASYHLERNASPKIVFLDTSLIISGIIKSA
ncbi:DNA polymerase III subunit delta [Rhodocytophaga rosea]|uniref:DNA polymerase III subunit delta n=1 Tax=Rhodocytophaga rosea TaxID=2704465 RepID=A0A6C0GGL1_9BACT|nr:DNA polymerase III subunit delta [Rhodocytophaga rosea]QHT67146.1 DNA polymerase III subunit delta [Rhodocytophaga rosea]